MAWKNRKGYRELNPAFFTRSTGFHISDNTTCAYFLGYSIDDGIDFTINGYDLTSNGATISFDSYNLPADTNVEVYKRLTSYRFYYYNSPSFIVPVNNVFSTRLWVCSEDSISADSTIWEYGTATPAQFMRMELNQDGQFQFSISDGTTEVVVKSQNLYDVGSYHFIVITADGTDMKLYMDNVLQETVDISSVGDLTNASGILRLFTNVETGASDLQNGRMFGFEFNNSEEWTAEEIDLKYNSEVGFLTDYTFVHHYGNPIPDVVAQPTSPANYQYLGGMVSSADDGSVFITTITAVGCSGGIAGRTPQIQIWRRSANVYTLDQEINGPDDDNDERWAVKACISGDGQTLVVPVPGGSNTCPGSDTTCGEVLIYKDSGGSFSYVSTLDCPLTSGSTNARIGYATAVSYDGEFLIVSYPTYDALGYTDGGGLSIYQDSAGSGTYTEILSLEADGDLAEFVDNDAWVAFHVDIDKTCSLLALSYWTAVGSKVRLYDIDTDTLSITYRQQFSCPDSEANDRFGTSTTGCENWFSGKSIALDDAGEIMVVGADGVDTVHGKTYIYRLNTISGLFEYSQTIEFNDTRTYQYYGYHVAISPKGKFIIIGCQSFRSGMGCADFLILNEDTDLFERSAVIHPRDTDGLFYIEDIYFGYSVDINDNIALIAATDEDYREDNSIVDIGSCYVYTIRGKWKNRSGY